MSTLQPTTSRLRQEWHDRGIPAVGVSAGVTALMWLLEGIDSVTLHALDRFGISSWNFLDLPSLLTSPLIHFGFGHLAANTVPFFLLSLVILLGSVWRWLKVTGITALTSGLAAFFLNPPFVNTAGMSGVIFGYVTFLIARGAFTRRWAQLAIGMVVAVVYGSVLWGVLPTTAGVSWQAHLGGAAGGVLAAWLLGRGDARPSRKARPVI